MAESFQETRWSLVLRAQEKSDGDSRMPALEEWCGLYWEPLYSFVRRSGATPEQAEDRVQEFFARLIEGDWLDRADSERGKLRTFLLTLLKRHLNDHRKGQGAAKRGGGMAPIPLDTGVIERQLSSGSNNPGATDDDAEYDRQWARTIFERSLAQVAAVAEKKGRLPLFEALRPVVTGETDRPIPEIADGLGMSDGAVHVALHRMRQQLRELIRNEVAETLLPGDDLHEEIRYLASRL